MTKLAQSSTNAAVKKVRGKPFQKGGDPRINKGGRVASALSLTAIVKDFSQMTPIQLAAVCATYAKQLKTVGGESRLIDLVAIRFILGLVDDPDPRAVALYWDRIDGKVTQPIDVSLSDELRRLLAGVPVDEQPKVRADLIEIFGADVVVSDEVAG